MTLRASIQAGLLNQSTAQVIDGSLKFDQTKKTYLTRTPGSAGNRKVWTLSYWIKLHGDVGHLFSANNDAFQFEYRSTGQLLFANSGSTSGNTLSTALFRDYGQFYHVVISHDAENTIARFYINGEQNFTATLTNADGTWNNATSHNISGRSTSLDGFVSFNMSQVYFVDGQALGPSYFGFTDPLTGTWRPKLLKDGDQATPNTQLLYNVNTSDNGFDSSSTTRTYDATNLEFSTYTTPQTANPGGYGANSAHVYKSPTGAAIKWLVSTDTSDRYIWTSEDGVNWTSKGSLYDTDGSTQSVTSTYIALAGGSNASNVTVTSAVVDFGTNGFYLPIDGNSPIGQDRSGKGNNWTPVNFGGSNSVDKATGALPILNTTPGGVSASVGVRTDSNYSNLVLALPLVGISSDVSNQINSGSTTKSPSVTGATFESDQSNFYGGGLYFNGPTDGASTATDYVTIADSNSEFVIGTGDFTMECWVWGNDWTGPNTNKDQVFMSHDGASGANNYVGFYIPAGVFSYYDGSAHIPSSNKPTLNDQQWYHVAVSRESGTSRVFLDGVLVGSASDTNNIATGTVELGRNPGNDKNQFNGYLQDFRLYVGTAKYTQNFIPASTSPDILPDTPSGVSGSSKLTKITDGAVTFDGTGDYLGTTVSSSDFSFGTGDFTVECYVYMTSASSAEDGIFQISTTSGGLAATQTNTITLQTNGGNYRAYLNDASHPLSTAVITDQWVHLALVRDSGTTKLYVNGVQDATTVTDTKDYSGTYIAIGGYYSTSYLWNGFISNFRAVKGTALYTSNFTPPSAPLTNVTNTKLLCCQSNTSATEAAVTPGSITANGDAAADTFNPFNTDINTVRGQETGYATLNPLNSATGTLSDGNLKYSISAVGSTRGALFANSGKYYFEVNITASGNPYLGIAGGGQSVAGGTGYIGPNAIACNNVGDIYRRTGGSTSYPGHHTTIGTGLFMIAFDADAKKIWWGKNGLWHRFDASTPDLSSSNSRIEQGLDSTDFSALDDSEGFTIMLGNSTTNNTTYECNFGQKPFKFPPPEGFQPLNAANVRPSTVIAHPDKYVGVTTYTGSITDTSSQTVTGINFQSDLVWIKRRDGSNSHQLVDSVRGTGKWLESSGTAIENSTNTNGVLTSLNSNGFTLTGGSTNANLCCESGFDYVGWCWKAGGNKNTFNVDDVGYASAAAAGLTGGDRTPTGASVGTKQGFSIIKFTGSGSGTPSIPHGLSEAPKFIIQKDTGATTSWRVFAYDGSTWKIGNLNNTDALVSATETAPTSSLFYANGNGNTTNTQIAYLWHDVPGLQKFGSYTGNNLTDGVFIELGFRPALMIFKRTGSTGNWIMIDNKRRYEFNPVDEYLFSDLTSFAYDPTNGGPSGGIADFLSNGVKLRENSAGTNEADTYIYAAWAEAPAFNLYGAQSNAR